MVEITEGNLLDADAEALVNTVNSIGIMGKGIALQFKQAFPSNFKAYEAACRRHEVTPGKMFVHRTNQFENPRLIINFPTKVHWRNRSRLQDIESGLRDLIKVVREEHVRSIAVPPLGCGSGGLRWSDVRPRIEKAFEEVPEVRVLLYAPEGAPKPEQMKVRTAKPRMTPGRAAILGLMHKYAVPEYPLTLLEVQKLAYFMQMAGEPLALDYQKQTRGPYAENLHHVLQRIEGHYIRGYGDRSQNAAIKVLPNAYNEVEDFLRQQDETEERFQRVAGLIDGFESPYGLELLATVHWVATKEDPSAKSNVEAAVRGIQAWSEYKRQAFRPEHIKRAWSRLNSQGWL